MNGEQTRATERTNPNHPTTSMTFDRTSILAAAAAAALPGLALAQSWVTLSNQTATRLVASPTVIGANNQEKDFAWGDVDQDGDVDLLCMLKFPGSIQGGYRNILLMNESGVLVDRTVEYGTASDISGYSGLMDPTNDRDVEVVDVNNDGWLDLVTATTMSDHVNSVLGQPRVYINLGNNASGQWRGFRFEVDRIPDLFARNGNVANPRFCDAAIADYNGDGYVDIFYTDYDTPETSGTICYDINGDGDTNDAGECQQSPAENAALDYDNKLLLNLGAANPGFFVDASTTMLTSAQITSGFGNLAVAGDFNGDGRPDICRINTLTTGQDVSIYTKSATAAGFTSKTVATGQPYHGDKADLNGDGRLDLIIVDDGQDKYLINTGNDGTGQPNFTSYTITDSLGEFGNSTQVGDLDKDGRPDVIICDVDADLGPFCPQSTGASHSRRTHIYRNTYSGTGTPTNILREQTPLPIAAADLDWWTDLAIFDINEDKGNEVAKAIGGIFCKVDINSEDSVVAGFAKARAAQGQERALIHCAMTSRRGKTLAFDKAAGKLKRLSTTDYEAGVQGVLVASYRVASLSAEGMANAPALEDGERIHQRKCLECQECADGNAREIRPELNARLCNTAKPPRGLRAAFPWRDLDAPEAQKRKQKP